MSIPMESAPQMYALYLYYYSGLYIVMYLLLLLFCLFYDFCTLFI
jgi:hypothetical protein